MQSYQLHTGAYMAAFHTALAVQSSCISPDKIEPSGVKQHVDRCVCILKTAAAAIVSVSDELASLGDVAAEFEQCLDEHITAARSALDKLVLGCQQ